MILDLKDVSQEPVRENEDPGILNYLFLCAPARSPARSPPHYPPREVAALVPSSSIPLRGIEHGVSRSVLSSTWAFHRVRPLAPVFH